ncbi:MAG: 3-oxoacyl-[acyl-carrier-protein] reductase [Deltaproteobacteria bacterium]|jgi:3-oxoacyl-[acyl-carrier protein] reductase|nr:3-oxoacyl-[acyl-carrier-protein] reductase [Deltaproteobacteria bacterium]MDH4008826.1 3-oxoacyl-[acyl-carrier-protein] reductase [Desulfuromonadales bacterium]
MLSEKVAIVTGASRGIGRCIALALAAQGAKVVASARNAEALDNLVEEIKQQGGEATAVVGDVAVDTDASELIDQAVAKYGQLDILVNNAGITRDGLLLRMKNEDWDAVLDTNLKGAFLCIRAAAKVMSKQRSGRIINISSVVGEMGNAGQANYCASKAGLLGLTKSVARELARRNVTVNAITPGFIVTDMTDDMTDKARQAMTEQIPLGRLGEVDDIANAVIFLASDQSSYITGQVLGINGGMYM